MKTDDKIAAYMKLFNLLEDDSKKQSEDDTIFRKDTKTQITNRDREYTTLLTHFVKITKIRNVLKEIFKWVFYATVIGSIIALIAITTQLFKKYFSSATVEQIIESLPLLTTAIIGFVSAIIAIPTTITKYLFSTKEDENITQIILHTQEHDVSGRKWAMEFKKMVEDLEEKSKQGTEVSKKYYNDSYTNV